MKIAEHLALVTWAEQYGGTAVLGYLCTMLLLGKGLHSIIQRKGLLFGYFVFPAVLLGGIAGLIFFAILESVDYEFSEKFAGGLDVIKANLINFMFSALAFGLLCSRSSSQHSSLKGILTSLFHEGMPMIIYSQILMWGQSMCCLMVSFCANLFHAGIPPLFSAMIPLGLEAGGDIAAKIPPGMFWSDSIVEETESLGLILTCCTFVLFISFRLQTGSLLSGDNLCINIDCGTSEDLPDIHKGSMHVEAFNRPEKTKDSSYALAAKATDGDSLVESAVSNQISNEKADFAKPQKDYATLGLHISLLASAVFLAFCTFFCAHLIEASFDIKGHILSALRMFKLSMFYAMLIMHYMLRKSSLKFNREWFMRLCGFMLDILIIAALSSSNPRPVKLDARYYHYGFVLLFTSICYLWNLFCFLVVARKLFPNFWFERGLVLLADSLGHSFSGLLVARTLDPLMQTPVPAAYAYKLMLFFIPSSGAKNTIITSIIDRFGEWLALIICFFVVIAWFLIFEKFFKHRFIQNLDEKCENHPVSRKHSGDNYVVELEEDGDTLPLLVSENAGRRKSVKISSDSESGISLELEDEGIELHTSPIKTIAGSSFQSPQLLKAPLKMIGESSILSPQSLNHLLTWLPLGCSVNQWKLVYSLKRDGACLHTLTSLASLSTTISSGVSPAVFSKASHIIVVQDSWGYVFGGYVPHAIAAFPSYYGTGECAVFSLLPKPGWYPWANRNELFVLSTQSVFAMGGGGDGYAFQLDDELDTGVSNHSDTFDNPCLSSSEYFKCLNVEIWSLSGIGIN